MGNQKGIAYFILNKIGKVEGAKKNNGKKAKEMRVKNLIFVMKSNE